MLIGAMLIGSTVIGSAEILSVLSASDVVASVTLARIGVKTSSVVEVMFPPESVGAIPRSLVTLLITPPRREVTARGSVVGAGSVGDVVVASAGGIDVEFVGGSVAGGLASVVLVV